MPFVYIPDFIEPKTASGGAADYRAYPKEHAYLFDEPRFDQPRHQPSYLDSYLPPNPYSQPYRQLSQHPDPYSRAHAHLHGDRHHIRPHTPPRHHLAYPYTSTHEHQPYTEADPYDRSAYLDAVMSARRRAEYEAKVSAAARAELAAEKALRERARAEQLAKLKRAAAIETYLAEEVARKEEKEQQRKIEKEKKRYEAAVAAAKKKIIQEEKQRRLEEASNQQQLKDFEQALQSAAQQSPVRCSDRAVSEQAEHDPIRHLLRIIGLDESLSQPQSRSQPSAHPQAGCQSKCEGKRSACHQQQSNDVEKHDINILERLMGLQQKSACTAAKREAAQTTHPCLTTTQPAKPAEPATQNEASKQAEINPLQFLLQLVEASSRKKDEPASKASPKSETPATDAPVWHWVPHPSVQKPLTDSASNLKFRTDIPSTSTAIHKTTSTAPSASSASVSSSSNPSPSLSQSLSSRLRLSTLNNRLSSLIDRPADKALNRSELEYELTRLLLEADEIDSDGDENLRGERKQFVIRVERVLDTLDIGQKQSQPQSQSQEEKAEKDNGVETTEKHELSLDSETSAPTTASTTEPPSDPTPATTSTNDATESSGVSTTTENKTDRLPADDLSIRPEAPAHVKTDGSIKETPAVISPTDTASATLSELAATLLSTSLATAEGIVDTHGPVSDASSDASSSPSSPPSPVVAASNTAPRRDSIGSNSSSSSSVRRGRKAYVEDAAEDGEDEFQIV